MVLCQTRFCFDVKSFNELISFRILDGHHKLQTTELIKGENTNVSKRALSSGFYGAETAESSNEKGNGLEEEVYEVAVLPMHKIIAST